MPIRDKISINHEGVVLKRDYPLRDQALRNNAQLQKDDAVKPTDGLRAFANFPEHELERLAEKGRTDKHTPSYYADLTSPDPRTRSNAKIKLVNSSEGREYRIGKTNRKSFRFTNNPLAKQ